MRILLLGATLLALTACGGGSSDSGGGGTTPVNQAPTANAGTAQTVNEFDTVTLNGSGTDPNGDTLTYSWTQQSGTNVTLSDASVAAPTFDAPDVTAVNAPETLSFRLTVSDGSLSSSATVNITVNDAGQGANSPPIADAGPDQDVAELVTVNLDGTGSSDPDGDTLAYSWTQTVGPNVTLTGGSTAQPNFPAPDVAAGSPVTFAFELTVDDGTDSAMDTVEVTVSEGLAAVDISGQLFYEQPQRNSGCRGYNFSNIVNRPIRRAPVELRDSGNNLVASTETDDNGAYAFSNVPARTDVSVRVLARSIGSGVPSWNVEVRDNTDQIASPLTSRPLYAKEWALFNTGGDHITGQVFVALTGWGAGSYTGSRDAAPFSILDALVDGVVFVTTADPLVNMGPLDAYWSINNSWAVTDDDNRDYDVGRIGITHYSSNPDGDSSRNPSMFLLGDAVGRFPETVSVNTDEFDRGVIQHEWGHFFEDELSRSDSIGGSHSIPGTLEPRVAFGEGWGYGISAIIGGDPVLCNTLAPATSGSSLNIENWSGYGTHGFFNEMSVATFLYDLYDPANEGATDNGELGFSPIYDTMVGPQKNTEAFTTIFSFGTAIKSLLVNPADRAFVDAMLNRENVDTGALDIWAGGQTTQPAGKDYLPVYVDLPTNGSNLRVCTNNDDDLHGDGNKPGEWRYFRFVTSGAARTWTLQAQANPAPPATNDPPDPDPDARGPQDRSDPDFYLYRNGAWLNWRNFSQPGSGTSGVADIETLNTVSLSADTYTIAFQDWRYKDPDIASDYPREVCFDITAN